MPVSTSHNRTVPSMPPERARLPSADNATAQTDDVWPISAFEIAFAFDFVGVARCDRHSQ